MQVQVLVVDDDALSRDILSLLLQRVGYAVEAVDSGDAALLHLKISVRRPQIVLTDLQMPGTTGRELAQKMRTLSPETVLLAMSATPPDDNSHLEFDGFLQKPFTVEAFITALGGAAAHSSITPTTKENDGTAPLDQTVYRKLAASMRPSQLEQFYTLCLSDAEVRVARMRSSAASRDDVTYRREAHAIKGSCGMVGATELQTLATSMEKHGLSDDHVASLDEFLVACQRLRRMLVANEITQSRASEVSGEDA
jgi:CheY-like chemotaxis protein/HPt (histidine-containing phosphotransfer) domain-containing protein